MKDDLKLYCQNCCARYFYCIDKATIIPYDPAAETCPDFIPKDIYKAVNSETGRVTTDKSSCYRKRLSIDPDYVPLPTIFPREHYTKETLEEAKRYALKMIEEEKKYGKNHE